MKSRKTKSLKVDSRIHNQIKVLQRTGLIKDSMLDFTNDALREKLERINHVDFNEHVTRAINQIHDHLHDIDVRIQSAKKKN